MAVPGRNLRSKSSCSTGVLISTKLPEFTEQLRRSLEWVRQHYPNILIHISEHPTRLALSTLCCCCSCLLVQRPSFLVDLMDSWGDVSIALVMAWPRHGREVLPTLWQLYTFVCCLIVYPGYVQVWLRNCGLQLAQSVVWCFLWSDCKLQAPAGMTV